MENKRPTVVKVVNHFWKITYNKDLCDKHMVKTGTEFFAYTDLDALSIVINHLLPDSLVKELCLHEVMHAINSLTDRAIENATEEQYVTFGAPILYATLTDPTNKSFFNFLFGQE